MDYATLVKLSMLLNLEVGEYVEFFRETIKKLLGEEYTDCLQRRVLQDIVEHFEEKKRDTVLLGKLAGAVVFYLLYEQDGPYIYWYKKKDWDTGCDVDTHRSIFNISVLRPIMCGIKEDEQDFDRLFPLYYEMATKAMFDSEDDDIALFGGYYPRVRGDLGEITISGYFRAYARGIISKEFLYNRVYDERYFEYKVGEISDYAKCIKDKGRKVASRKRVYGGANPDEDLYFKDDDETNRKLDEIVLEVYGDVSTKIMESELKRGDIEAEYSKYVMFLRRIYGIDYFVRILTALGKSKLERNEFYSFNNDAPSKTQSLSQLLAVCIPEKSETVDDLRKALKGKKITEKRLIEAALYSPEWNELVGEYLGWEGFTSCSYYFMAHMNEHFDEKRKGMIARYTPLTTEELQNGAFDCNWFREVYKTFGPERFKEMYECCKYITIGAKHTRARKYADAALGLLKIEDTKKEIEEKRNKDLLMGLGAIPSVSEEDLKDRYVFMKRFEKESRKFGAQRRASEALASQIAINNMAMANGYKDNMRFVLRMESKVTEGLLGFFHPVEVEDVVVYLEALEDGKVGIVCEKDGKRLKNVPAKLKKEEYIVDINEAKKELAGQFARTREMLESAMQEETVYTLGEIRELTVSPVVKVIMSKLVFKLGDEFGFLSDFEDKKSDEEVLIAHPLHLYKAGVWQDFQKRIYDEKIIQPFKQVFRELYVRTEEENECTNSMRFAGNQVQKGRALALLKTRGWIPDYEEGLQKVFYKKDLIANIYAMADWFSPAEIEAPTLEWVVFYDRNSYENVRIKDVPEIIFSETMRDVDLVVSVAHAGDVDPEFSHSTIEIRKAIAEFTIGLLGLTNVTFTDNHAKIKGTRGEYNIHLGSGVIHKAAGPMINVLPVHSQHRGRIFLPFVDYDPKTAEVITKIVLFAEDEKIKDPFILNQI